MTDYTAEEVKQVHIDRMGPDLGRQYDQLWQEMAYVHQKWDQYVVLFGTKPGRIDLLNRSAGLFFRIVQDVLWEDTILHLARLTDPSNSMNNKVKANLTLQNFPGLISDPQVKADVVAALDDAIGKTEFCRDWRNRHIAHRDLNLAIEASPLRPLLPASRAQVKEALAAAVRVLNVVSGAYLGSEPRFDLTKSPHGAEELIYLLYDGLQARKKAHEDHRAGVWTRPDYPREIF